MTRAVRADKNRLGSDSGWSEPSQNQLGPNHSNPKHPHFRGPESFPACSRGPNHSESVWFGSFGALPSQTAHPYSWPHFFCFKLFIDRPSWKCFIVPFRLLLSRLVTWEIIIIVEIPQALHPLHFEDTTLLNAISLDIYLWATKYGDYQDLHIYLRVSKHASSKLFCSINWLCFWNRTDELVILYYYCKCFFIYKFHTESYAGAADWSSFHS